MSLAGQIAWDDTILPFQLDRADVRGRVARLDSVLETILGYDGERIAELAVAEVLE